MALITIAGRPVHIQGDRPTIGKYYEPPKTLRTLPRHWQLEEAMQDRRWRWWADGDFMVGVVCAGIVLFFAVQAIVAVL